MDLVGVLVKHKVCKGFGEGRIKQLILEDKNEYITVHFPQEQEDKEFQFPDAFEKLLSIIDNIEVESFIKWKIQKKKQIEFEKRIKEICEKREIKYLIHFTRLDNLHSILQNGLVPVSIQHKMKIPSVHNDEQRIDMKLDCTSCSVGFPNYKLFYPFRTIKFSGTRWVVIKIDKDVLFSPTNIAYYCRTNAARIIPKISSKKELCTVDAFESMFYDPDMIRSQKLQINDRLTTDPQAEILIENIIDKKYIACICFYNQQDIDFYIRENGSEVISKYEHQIEPMLFGPRNDYMFWKKEL